MLPKYGEHLRLCYMDSDPFVYNIATDNFYAEDIKTRFDTSGYSFSHLLLIGVNKKVGLMKDELGRQIMTEFMALRLKMYAYKMLSGSGDKKCKGVKKCAMKKTVDLEGYKQCQFAGKKAFWKKLLFQNRLHEVRMAEVNKLALTLNRPGFLQIEDYALPLCNFCLDGPIDLKFGL